MNDDKWLDVLDKIRADFGIEEESMDTIEDIPNSKVQTIIFVSPLGRMKLVRTTKPLVIDKKTVYSNRAGSSMNTTYVYAENEFTHSLEVFRFDDISNDWLKAAINL